MLYYSICKKLDKVPWSGFLDAQGINRTNKNRMQPSLEQTTDRHSKRRFLTNVLNSTKHDAFFHNEWTTRITRVSDRNITFIMEWKNNSDTHMHYFKYRYTSGWCYYIWTSQRILVECLKNMCSHTSFLLNVSIWHHGL